MRKDLQGFQKIVIELGIQREALNLPGGSYDASTARDKELKRLSEPLKKVRENKKFAKKAVNLTTAFQRKNALEQERSKKESMEKLAMEKIAKEKLG